MRICCAFIVVLLESTYWHNATEWHVKMLNYSFSHSVSYVLTFLKSLDLEVGGRKLLRNGSDYLPQNMLYFKRPEYDIQTPFTLNPGIHAAFGIVPFSRERS